MINTGPMRYGCFSPQLYQVPGPTAVHHFWPNSSAMQPPSNLYQTFQPAQVATPSILHPLSNICKMSVQETANWIYNLGIHLKWDKADCYAYSLSFRREQIDGTEIMHLNHEKLLKILKVKKLGHRLTIIKEVMHLRRQKMIEKVNIMARFHEQCEIDSLFHPSLSTSESERMSAPVTKARSGKKLKKVLGSCARRYGVSSDGVCRRHSASYDHRSKRIAKLRSNCTIGRELSYGSDKEQESFLFSWRAQTSCSSSTDDITTKVKKQKDEQPIANSFECSSEPRDNLSNDASNDNDLIMCPKSGVIAPLKTKSATYISLRSSSEACSSRMDPNNAKSTSHYLSSSSRSL